MFLNKESLNSQILKIIKTIIKQREGSIILVDGPNESGLPTESGLPDWVGEKPTESGSTDWVGTNRLSRDFGILEK